jgi:L-ascorbate metabolism protein UlaG (beta-lactamase superfamily)
MAHGETLAIDPFFTRPSYSRFLFGRPLPDPTLAARLLPHCDYVFVSHAHWDHVMDVPVVARITGAVAHGSPNTCRLLEMHDVPARQIRLVGPGDRLTLGPFEVEVLQGDHGWVPVLPSAGNLAADLRPPLRLREYRMDSCFSFLVEVDGYRFLMQPGPPLRADLLFVVPAMLGTAYYAGLLHSVRPAVVVPIHWDNLFHPLSRPLHETPPLTGIPLTQLRRLVARMAPWARFLVPEFARSYRVPELLASGRPALV